MGRICFALFLVSLGLADGYSRFKGEIPNGYSVPHPCPNKGHWEAVGHNSPGYTPRKNIFGENFRDAGRTWNTKICRQDSDGDGLTNGEELGDPQCTWKPGQPAPGPVLGHPGFCEQDRQKCDSGKTHDECPNPRAGGRQSQSSAAKRLPPGANDHPQTFLSKSLQEGGHSFGQSGFRQDFGSSFGGNGMSSGGFRGGFDMQPGGQQFGSQGFGRMPDMSRDFGFSDSQFMGTTALPDHSFSDGSMVGFSNVPDMSRFRSSLDQRSIQGSGFQMPSFPRSMSASDPTGSRFSGSMGAGFGSSFMDPTEPSAFSSRMGSFSSPFVGGGGDFSFGPGMSGGPGMSRGPGAMMSAGFRPF